MSAGQLPEALRRAFERDPRPVRPLAPPGRRALALLPAGLLLVAAVPLVWGWRQNLSSLGVVAAWGLSVLQTLAGLALVGLALREAVPGRELSTRAVVTTLAAAVALFLAITLATQRLVPTVVPARLFVRWAWECFAVAALSALPPLALAAWLVARALPTRPALAGAIYGLGAGIMADAGVRLFCWISSPWHVVVSHGGAILAAAALGALSAHAVDVLRTPRRR